jgi:hypothetical protein
MDKQNYTRNTTYLTLLAIGIGFLGYTEHYALWLFYLPVVLLPRFVPFGPHSLLVMASITATTFVFGIVNGHTFTAVRAYLQEEETELPVFSLYLSLISVYHYFEFQLVNNFHYSTLTWQSTCLLI